MSSDQGEVKYGTGDRLCLSPAGEAKLVKLLEDREFSRADVAALRGGGWWAYVNQRRAAPTVGTA